MWKLCVTSFVFFSFVLSGWTEIIPPKPNTSSNAQYASVAGYASNALVASNTPYASWANNASNVLVASNTPYASWANNASNALVASNTPYASWANNASNALKTPWEQANSNYVSSISNTTLGSEGIRSVGSFGGYMLDEFFEDTYVRGPARDTVVFVHSNAPSTNITVSWGTGDVYDPLTGYFHLVPGTNDLTDNAVNYAYWTPTDPYVVKWTTGTRPNVTNTIYLGTFVVSYHMLMHVGETIPAGNLAGDIDNGAANVIPSLIVSGMTYFGTDTNLNYVKFNSGIEYHNLSERIEHHALDLTNFTASFGMLMYGHTNSVWAYKGTNYMPIDVWDDGTNFIPVSLTNWYRGVLLSVADSPFMHWMTPDQQFTNYAAAVSADDPDLPPGFDPYIPKCTAYVFYGGDTSLRIESDYWLDRRFQIRRASLTTGGGGGSGNTPTLGQVLVAGKGTGGILPNGMGNPTADDEAANKGYVDSTTDKSSTGKATVDRVNGDDGTGQLNKGSRPFKTIQAAIDAAAAVASQTNRYLVLIGSGAFTEDVTMKNYISIRGWDTENTIIYGTITYPAAYTDTDGAEVSLLTISQNEEPALVLSAGEDDAYMGIRGCWIKSTYTNDTAMKTLILGERGYAEIYGTSYLELDLYPSNGAESVCNAQIFQCSSNAANNGQVDLISLGNSVIIACDDANDILSVVYSDNQVDNRLSIKDSFVRINSETEGIVYTNKIILAKKINAKGSIVYDNNLTKVRLLVTNDCDTIIGYSSNSAGHVYANHNTINVKNVGTNRSFYASSSKASDLVDVIGCIISAAEGVSPGRYTNDGALGSIGSINMRENGGLVVNGSIDLQTTITPTYPISGHIRIYSDTTPLLENPYFTDSNSNKIRIARDTMNTFYNDDVSTLQVGEAVYVSSGVSGTANKIKRAKANSINTLPCIGVVANPGGIAVGAKGRVMRIGRTELYKDTSMWATGDKLYVSETVAGGITNVAPSGTNIAQEIGRCNVSGTTNGLMLIYCWTPESINGQNSKYYIDTATNQLTLDIPKLKANAATNADYASVANLASNVNSKVGSSTNADLATYASVANLASNVNSKVGSATNADLATYASVANLASNVNSKVGSATNADLATYASVANLASNVNSKVGSSTNADYASVANLASNVNSKVGSATNADYASVANLASNVNSKVGSSTNADLATYASVANLASNVNSKVGSATNADYASVANLASNVNSKVGSSTNSDYASWANNASNTSWEAANSNAVQNGTNQWNSVTNISKFWANTLVAQTFTNGAVARYALANSLWNFGGTYNTDNSRWYPKVTNKMVRFDGSVHLNPGNGDIFNVFIYKNGVNIADVLFHRAAAAADDIAKTFVYVDRANGTGDYYEVWGLATGANIPTTTLGTNNWWFGEVVH